MRKLASICTIEKTWPLEGKDRVQGASFVENGYEVMIGKDMNPGDKAVFIQEGSILPIDSKWEFLRKRCYKERLNGFLIVPQKFGSIKSWGLTISLKDAGLPESLQARDDVTDLLNIRKYDPEEYTPQVRKTGKQTFISKLLKYKLTRWLGKILLNIVSPAKESCAFPTDLISKSDETTIQNMKDAVEKFAETNVYVTAKMEGQSVTVIPVFKRGKLTGLYPCSRNMAYPKETVNDFWKALKKYDLLHKMQDLYKRTGHAYIIQAEQCGPGIQRNIYNFSETKWFVYTIKDYQTGKQLNLYNAQEITRALGLEFVPVIASDLKLREIGTTVGGLVTLAENVVWYYDNKKQIVSTILYTDTHTLWKDCIQHEGVVIRSMDYDKDNNIGVSFKVKNIQYAEMGLSKIANVAQTLLHQIKK